VESDVGYAQRNFFAPNPKAKDFAELNAVLHQACWNDMQRNTRGESRSMAEVWQSEKPFLLRSTRTTPSLQQSHGTSQSVLPGSV